MKLLLSGGVLAEGIRKAVSLEDVLMEQAARDDFFAERYGWTVTEIDEQPHDRIERMAKIAAIKGEIEQDRARRAQAQADAQAAGGR